MDGTTLAIQLPVKLGLLVFAIVGGHFAAINQWSNVVALDDACTGSLIAPHVVLFAAHCDTPSEVLVGNDIGAPERSVPVTRCVRHPEAALKTGRDFAFCVLSESINLPAPRILQAGEAAALRPGQPAVIVGFGRDDHGAIGRKRVAETTVRCITRSGQILAGDANADTCTGDSGGPLFVATDGGSWRLAGVLSAGTGCGKGGFYDFVGDALPWLETEAGIDPPGVAARTPRVEARDEIGPTAPQLESSPTVVNRRRDGQRTVSFSVRSSDAGCGLRLYRLEVDDKPRPPVPATSTETSIRVLVADERHTVRVVAEDWSGNRSDPLVVKLGGTGDE